MVSWWSTCKLFLVLLWFSLILNFCSMFANALHDSLQQPRQSQCHDEEKSALLAFKLNFHVDCSASDPNFARPKMESWLDSSSPYDHQTSHSTSDCCRWDGVLCDEKTGHVIGLDLSSSCLFGDFPPNTTLFGLDHLRELDLSYNDFNHSQIPLAIGRLSELTRLNLSYSVLRGQIPFEISTLSSLSILDLSYNNLELGNNLSFEKLVGNLTGLTHLFLDYVDMMSSNVPVFLSNFTSLKALSLSYCNLNGEFPPTVILLPKLMFLVLTSNGNLQGFLPKFQSNSVLQILDLQATSFSGELTPSIGNLDQLITLSLSASNGFTGPIPWSLGNLTKLKTLGLACNFEGDLPLSLMNLTRLTALKLSNVRVQPRIMNSWLLNLSKLEVLGLTNMNLHMIPPATANLTRLEYLDFDGNALTSVLPYWLANLTKIRYLDLQGNQFQGPIIPWWFSHLQNLECLFIDSNGSSAMFDTLLKIPRLNILQLSGMDLIFPPYQSINSSLPQFSLLILRSCKLTKFPQFLRHQHQLQSLKLSSNKIEGTIPQWLVNATVESLLEIDLSDNLITGFEQPQEFLPWNNLEMLAVGLNKFQGRLLIPPKSLKVYGVSQNQFSGKIPKKFCEASSLKFLDLSFNNLVGKIPTCFGLSANLQILNLGANHIQGTIPKTFTRDCKYQMIKLNENQLEGQLPNSLAHCQKLEILDLGNNRLNDSFPSWLGSIPNLQVLVLRHNQFHGKIVSTPNSSDHFHKLRILDLSYNFYDGNLPWSYLQNWQAMRVVDEDKREYTSSPTFLFKISTMSFGDSFPYSTTITNKRRDILYSEILKVFRVLDFSRNNFTGGIPDDLGNLRGLQALNLSNNQLSGSIPSSLANIIDLEALDLSQNMLSGEIPQEFTKLTSLEIFDVSHNHLVGPIPQGEQFNTFDNSSYDGNLALCGFPLSKMCGHTYSRQPPPSTTDAEGEEDSKWIDWIIRSMGCVSGCIVGFVLGKVYITDPHHHWFMKTFGRKRMPKTRSRRSAPSHTRRT